MHKLSVEWMSSLAKSRQLSRIIQAALPWLIAIALCCFRSSLARRQNQAGLCCFVQWFYAVIVTTPVQFHRSLANMFPQRQTQYANLSTMGALSAITQICIAINTKKDFKIWSRTCHDLALTLVAILQMLWSGDTNWFDTCAQAFTLEALTRLNHACILFLEQTRILLVFCLNPLIHYEILCFAIGFWAH